MMDIHPYEPKILNQMLRQAKAAEAAIQASVRDTLLEHKRAGLPVVTWQDGRVIWVPADEIVVDEPSQS